MMLMYWVEAYIIERDREASVVGSQDVGLEVNAEKTNY